MARDPIEARLAAAGLPALPRRAWLEIDLDALRSNLDTIRRVVGPGVRVEPVVKADAYGHGAVPVARALGAAGADGLSVATVDEAFELREDGVELPLLVLYPIPPEQVAAAAGARIAVSIGAGAPTDAIVEAARVALAAGSPPLDVHLEIETGLGRGGALPGELAGALAAIAGGAGVRLAGVWSHLAAANDLAGSRLQDARFHAALAPLVDSVELGPATVRRHLAGSGGVLAADVTRWDAVRPGLSTYGLVPDALTPPGETVADAATLRPAMALLARPVRVTDLPAGHGVSYGPTFTTTRPSRIATLPVGYGDGWHRILSDRAFALVRGSRVPLVGRVAMDAVMADVTDVPGERVHEGDEFVLLGSQGGERIGAADLAEAAGTITYEVVTSMSRRLPRVYHAAGSVKEVRTLAGRRAGWHASSSGTGTSATWRSTPS
ncbi:MAG TPA: alanine racemase [Candidatus Limnocylindrales bacterium]